MAKISLDDKYALSTTRAYMTGIEALVRLPILQHQRDLDNGLNTAGFISGYRGSPLGSVDQAMWHAKSYLDEHNIVFQPGINEDLAATAVWGSQQVNLFDGAKYDGVFSMWYGKGPGVDRSMDVIKHANAFGTAKYGGVLAIAGDDHASKSSTLPHQSEHMFIGASIPVLNPANVQEVLDLGVFGWELSRYCGSWVALKAITDNMDSAISADIDPQRVKIVIPESFELPQGGVHARLDDTPLAQEERLNKYKIYAAREFARVNKINKVVLDSPKAKLGIITTGKAFLDVMQALEDLGIDEQKAHEIGLRVFKVGMSWPLEPVSTHAFADGLDEILVVEEKRSIIEDQLTGQLYNWPVDKRPVVIGEFDQAGNDFLPNLGELTPAMVARAIAARMSLFYNDEQINKRLEFYNIKEQSLAKKRPKIDRVPHYCSGCPHSSGTRIPEGSRALGGIGCHYMGTWQKGDRKAETFSQMGGEGVAWIGQAPFTDTQHVFQNLGDGTYFHSGILAIRQSIAAKVNITYKILYNDAVAMTGGQSVDGNLTIPDIINQLKAEGIERIALVSEDPDKYPRKLAEELHISIDHRRRLLSVEDELRNLKGTTVLIYDQTCAAEKRRRRKKGLLPDPNTRIFINPEVCEGCGDCSIQSNCLSVMPLETELGRKRQIDQSACNKDFSCVNGFCPSFVSIVGASLRTNNNASSVTLKELPTPNLAPIEDRPWNILITGIGGTGVLTISALVSMAAHIEGKGCATMNQTGLAQKFGAVISHVRIGKTQDAINSVRIPAGDADLLLGCDLVVAASDEAIAKVNIERSYAIVNDFEAMTAEFVTNPDLDFPSDAMKQTLSEEVGPSKVTFINATDLATHLFGDSIASNVFLLGFAYQQGMIPVGQEALLEAIELNGVQISLNQKAFEWGRYAATDLNYVSKIAAVHSKFTPLEGLQDIVDDRYQRLVNYQDTSYAEHYKMALAVLMDADKQYPERENELSIHAAKQLFRAMAYKDEYEVARLYSDENFLNAVSETFEGDFSIEFHLSPPLLAGHDPDHKRPKKYRLPGWIMKPVFKLLQHGKALRGSRFDIFGYSDERRQERNLISQYIEDMQWIAENLNTNNYSQAVQLLSAFASVRGYGPVKMKNIEQYQSLRNDWRQRFADDGVETVKFVNAA
jgi:indolepyruvate ferredoxin oxidoreductase